MVAVVRLLHPPAQPLRQQRLRAQLARYRLGDVEDHLGEVDPLEVGVLDQVLIVGVRQNPVGRVVQVEFVQLR